MALSLQWSLMSKIYNEVLMYVEEYSPYPVPRTAESSL